MIRALLAALVLAACASTAQAQTRPAVTGLGPDYPKVTIFIGNSFFYYNNGLPGHVTLLEKAADPEHGGDYGNTMVTIGGSGFDWHDVESYFRPNAIGSYRFDENNNIVFSKRDKLFDAAVMMDCSQCPIHPKLKSVFTEYAKEGCRHRPQPRHAADLLHVMGLCRQAGDDRAARRGLHGRGQRQ